MVKQDFTKAHKIGASKLVTIPATIMRDDEFPFKDGAINGQLLIEIMKDKKGRPGLFIRKP